MTSAQREVFRALVEHGHGTASGATLTSPDRFTVGGRAFRYATFTALLNRGLVACDTRGRVTVTAAGWEAYDAATKPPPVRERYTEDELRDHALADLRVDYACARRDAAVAIGALKIELIAYSREVASKIASTLGHVALFQGSTGECSRCGMTGALERVLNGDLFTFACGAEPAWGKEQTPEQCLARARWEWSQAREVEAAAATLGASIVATMHRRTALAYEAQALRVSKEGSNHGR